MSSSGGGGGGGNSSTPPSDDNDAGVGSLLKQTLMNVDECFLYRVPPLTTSGGHRAEQWDLSKPLQTCGFQVERRNNDLYLLFTTEDHTKLYALSKIQENSSVSKSVEPVVDSSRYFVTQVQSGGGLQGGGGREKTAYVGFGFRDRDVALDLLGNLQQFQKSIQREQQAKNMKVTDIPKLAEGEKIHISFGTKGAEKKKKKPASSTTASSSGGLLLLKKPPKPAEATIEGAAPNNAPIIKNSEDASQELHLSMGNINLQDDHKSVASADSDVAHGGDARGDIGGGNDDEDEWDDFQQA